MNRLIKHSMIIFTSFLFWGCSDNTTDAPSGIGNIRIGMSKAEYLSTVGATPIDCKEFKDKNEKTIKFDITNIDPSIISEYFSFCEYYNKSKELFSERDSDKIRHKGTDENIQIGDISYNIVTIGPGISETIGSIGQSARAIFFNDKLISIYIEEPKIDIETLEIKYGKPKVHADTEEEICRPISRRKPREVKIRTGILYSTWRTNIIEATLGQKIMPFFDCDETVIGKNIGYSLSERKQMKLVNSAIYKFIKNLPKIKAKSSQF